MLKKNDIKKFWDLRAQTFKEKKSYSAINFEENIELQELKIRLEREKVFKHLPLQPDMNVLDLGAGVGAWSIELAQKCKQVVAVEYSKAMIHNAKQLAAEYNIHNITYVHSSVEKYTSPKPFDLIFCSGILLYISDAQIQPLLKNMHSYSCHGTFLFLREPTGLHGRYEIINKYSEALKTKYSALYRSKEELIHLFNSKGFLLQYDSDMFEEGSPLNKWKETRLRIYLFKRGKNPKNDL